jgi:hypothetical protein
MSSLIGAKNKPIIPNFKIIRHQEYINKKCCLLLEDIPDDTTSEEILCLTDKLNVEIEDLFFPFNLLTQKQLPKVYIFVKDCYKTAFLLLKLKTFTLYNRPISVKIFKGKINY